MGGKKQVLLFSLLSTQDAIDELTGYYLLHGDFCTEIQNSPNSMSFKCLQCHDSPSQGLGWCNPDPLLPRAQDQLFPLPAVGLSGALALLQNWALDNGGFRYGLPISCGGFV